MTPAAAEVGEEAGFLASEVRSVDPDRFRCAVFAPADARPSILAAILLNHEVSRVRALVTEPMIAAIRYQWWRERLAELEPGRIAQPAWLGTLAQPLRRDPGLPSLIEGMIDAREEAFADGDAHRDLEGFAAATSGALQVITLRLTGTIDEEASSLAGRAGTAYGLFRLAMALCAEQTGLRSRAGAAERRAMRRGEAAVPAADHASAMSTMQATIGSVLDKAQGLARQVRAQARPSSREMCAFLPASIALSGCAGLRAALNRESADAFIERWSSSPLHLLWRDLLRRP